MPSYRLAATAQAERLQATADAAAAEASRDSPSDTLPVRRWAKLTMMVQSTLSLVIAILVLARAINILPV
jgi:hypothetical protein